MDVHSSRCFGEARRRDARDEVYGVDGEVAQLQTPPNDGHPQGRGLYTVPSQSPWVLEEIQYVSRILRATPSPTSCLGDAVVVNPEISSGLPLPTMNRNPPPGSRPEKYATPATKGASPSYAA